jgi:hypothetical protein
MSNGLVTPSDPPPVAAMSLVAAAQAALGCGIGLLVASKLPRPARQVAALAMLSVGVLSAVPLLVEIVARQWNRPESERGMRKRLETIREDSGFTDDAEVF